MVGGTQPLQILALFVRKRMSWAPAQGIRASQLQRQDIHQSQRSKKSIGIFLLCQDCTVSYLNFALDSALERALKKLFDVE